MKLALSTNWSNRRLSAGEEIADEAAELGFDELELGFCTWPEQVKGFRARIDSMPVGSIHAFCPVPVSAPHGHPELYSLASPDPGARALAAVHLKRNIDFAADIGARTVVLHAGRVALDGLFGGLDSARLNEVLAANGHDVRSPAYAKLLAKAVKRRRRRGEVLLEAFRREVESLVPHLEKRGVALAFENLPYLEGFPDEAETRALAEAFAGAPVKGWFDTGHDRVRRMHGWVDSAADDAPSHPERFAGMHLNDVADFNDDHFAPGFGNVDFAAFEAFAAKMGHVVFEPSEAVSAEKLRKGIEYIRKTWHLDGKPVETH